LNRSTCPIDPARLEVAANNLRSRSYRVLQSLGREAESCFQLKWQMQNGEEKLLLDKAGYARKNDKNLRAKLESEFGQFSRVCNIPLDLPRNPEGSLSLKYGDWVPFRHFSRFVELWTDLEVSGVVQTKQRKDGSAFRDYHSFPTLQSATVGVFSESVEECFLAPPKGYKLVEIHLNDLFLRSALAVNVVTYGLDPTIYQEPYDDEDRFPLDIYRYFIENIGRVLQCQDNKDALVWHSLSEEAKRLVIDQMATSGLNQESADSAVHRLRSLAVSMPPREVTYLRSVVWELLVRCSPSKEYHWQRADSRNYFSPGPNVTAHSALYEELPWLKDSARLSEILFQVAVNHFSYRFGIPRTQLASVFSNEVKSRLPSTSNEVAHWSIVDRLEKTAHKVKTLLSYAYQVAFQKPPLYVGENFSRAGLFQTNAVSCLGRVGEPVHYANVIAADIELFRRDMALRIAFDLMAKEFDVVWVSDQVLIVQLPVTSIGASSTRWHQRLSKPLRKFSKRLPSPMPVLDIGLPVAFVGSRYWNQLVCSLPLEKWEFVAQMIFYAKKLSFSLDIRKRADTMYVVRRWGFS